MVREERNRLGDEADGARCLLVGTDGNVRDACGVVDCDVEVVVPDPPIAPGVRSEHPVTAAGRHASEAFDVDVDELARPFPDIADGNPGEPIGVGEPAHAMPAQDAVHRRAGMTQQRAQAMRTDTQPSPCDEDPADLALGQRPRPAARSRRAVVETSRALFAVSAQPLVRGRPAHPEHLGRSCRRPALDQDPINQQPSAERRQLGRTMKHESPPSDWSFDNPKPSTRALTLSTM